MLTKAEAEGMRERERQAAEGMRERERQAAEGRKRAARIAQAEKWLDWSANHFAIPVDVARHVIETSPADAWAKAFGGGVVGAYAASEFARFFADLSCANADHEAETRLAAAVVQLVEPGEGIWSIDSWVRLVTGLRHVLDETTDVRVHAEELRATAVEAIADLRQRYGENELRRSDILRSYVDKIAAQLGHAEQVLGLPPSEPVSDMHRRMRARAIPSRATTFFSEHRAGLMAVWRRDRREWYRQHYIELHETEPPDGWWWDDPETMGGHIAPGFRRDFGILDQGTHRQFLDEMERRYREENQLPARGEGWVSQTHLANCVEQALPDYEVIREASPDWLAPHRLDIFVPALHLAVECQGEQHFYPLDHWGGDQGLADRQAMDERKRDACRKAGVVLVEWSYDDPIGVEAVRDQLLELGLVSRR